MQYSPKLKKAAEEIKEILEKYDIAAIVALHSPGFSEYVTSISPTYSCAKVLDGGAGIHFKTTHLPTKSAKSQMIKDTANMFHLLGVTACMETLKMKQCSEVFNDKFDIEHLGGGHTSHNQQNN